MIAIFIIFIIFFLVVSAATLLIIRGCREMCLYIIGSSRKSSKAKRGLSITCYTCFAVTMLVICAGIFLLGGFLCTSAAGKYVAVMTYTILLALMATNELYISPSLKVDSKGKAFRRGFTNGGVNNIIPNLYLKTIINIAYLAILICAQIEDLNLVQFNREFSYFCTLNKYGIVVIFAIEKMISSIASEKKRKKTLNEASVDQERKEEQDREETRQQIHTLKLLLKERRELRKQKRQGKKER